jgi:uncharacterized RDD family membrane protein YckC
MGPSPDITLYPASRLRILTAYCVDAAVALLGSYGLSQMVSIEPDIQRWMVLLGAVLSISAGQGLLLSQRGARTLGRRVTGLIVVSADGEKLSLIRRWARFPLACVSWAFGGIGILWLLIDPLHRTWHDILTGTVEVPRLIRVKSQPSKS